MLRATKAIVDGHNPAIAACRDAITNLQLKPDAEPKTVVSAKIYGR